MPGSNSHRGFTLVELILVMALLAIVMALAAPSLSRSMRERGLNGEAMRFLAAIDYARDEAISQGVPMAVFIFQDKQRFGVAPPDGYPGVEARNRTFSLNADVHFDTITGNQNGGPVNGAIGVLDFTPDGSRSESGPLSVRMVDRFGSAIVISDTGNGAGFQLMKESK